MQKLSLLGRTRERDAIARLIAAAVGGRGGALHLRGDLGIGKSALLEHAAETATGVTVLRAAGLDQEAALPYAALHRLLRPLTGSLDSLPACQAATLRRAIEGNGCAESDRLMLCVATLGLLGAASRALPVLCCVDDAHGMDPESFQVLAFVARRLDTERVAILFAQDSAAAPVLGIPELRLAPLAEIESGELLAHLLRGAICPITAAALVALADGNPQALVDLAGSLTAAQQAGTAAPPVTLPADSALRRGYRQRLARLPDETRWLLLLAAADEELDAPGLVSAARVSNVDISALAPAELCGLVQVHGAALRFPQPLVRSLAYDDAPLAQRRSAHLVLARTLQRDCQRLRRAMHQAAAAQGPDPRLAAELSAAVTGGEGYGTASTALELAAALTDDPRDAARRLLRAAHYAWLAGHPHEARTLLRRMAPIPSTVDIAGQVELLSGEMELRAGTPATALRSLLSAADTLAEHDPRLSLSALMRAGEAICFSGDHYRYACLQRRAEALRTRLAGDLEEPAIELMLEHLSGFAATFRADHEAALRSLHRVVALAPLLEDAAALASASAAGLLLGDDLAAYRLATCSLELAQATGDMSAVPRALERKACAEYWLGRYDAATATCLDGLRSAHRCGHETSVSIHSAMLAVLAAVRGDRPACLRWLRDATVPVTGTEVNRPTALGRWALAILDLGAGRAADALARMASIANAATARGHVVVQVMATPHLVEAAARGSDRRAALAALEVFERWAGSTKDPVRRALAARCRALLARRGSHEAEAYFREALRLHLVSESPFERARTQLLYGQQLRRARRPRDAREHLHAALETFQRFDAPAWVARAVAELRAAGEQVEAEHAEAEATLTAQQLQIARMVCDGATNREVAAQLLLSTRTVDHHMRNIFAKLGIRSRVELTRLVT